MKKATSLKLMKKLDVENAELNGTHASSNRKNDNVNSTNRKKKVKFVPSNLIAKGRGELSGVIAEELLTRKELVEGGEFDVIREKVKL